MPGIAAVLSQVLATCVLVLAQATGFNAELPGLSSLACAERLPLPLGCLQHLDVGGKATQPLSLLQGSTQSVN